MPTDAPPPTPKPTRAQHLHAWRKKLEASGFRVLCEPEYPDPAWRPSWSRERAS